MFSKRLFGLVAFALMTVSMMGPLGSADYEEKTEYEGPDEIYFDLEGRVPLEDKTEGRTGSGGSSLSTSSYNITTDLLKKGASSTTRSFVSFPYEEFGWSIGTWYRSSEGFRFYNVEYNNEKILYDYVLPWVEVEDTKYVLEKDMRSDGPDLFIYNNAEVFKVWIEYYIDTEEVYVEVYAYFGSDGEFDPWAKVSSDRNVDIVVGQRFDFDLDGAGDDNAEFYSGAGWSLVEFEDSHPDAGEPEDGDIQWSLYDTDVQGTGYIYDQTVDFIPYHLDDSYLYILRWHSSQKDGFPLSYDDDEPTGLYSPSTYDPYIGSDLVAWYVSEYSDVDFCNPGPWILVEV